MQNSPHIAEPPLKPETPFYYGWVVMPVAALMVVGTLPGQTVVVSQFNTSIRESLGIGNDALALAYLIGTLCAAVPLTLVGKLSDRIGPRRTAGLVVGSFLLGILALTNAAGLVSLTIGFILIRFLGQGALGMLSSHVLALWFERRLATVESIKHAAISLAGAVVPALVLVLINEFGWRRAYAVLGIAVAAVLLPLIAFVLRDRPEEIGQHLDNEPPEHHERWHDAHVANVMPRREVVFTLRETIATRSFWLLIAPGVLSGLAGTAMLFHIQPILTAAGLAEPERAGASAVAFWSVAMFCGLVSGGPIADRLPPRAILPVAGLGTGVSALVLQATASPLQAGIAMAIFGLSQGWGIAAAGPAIARFFGRPHHGSIRGFVTTAMVAGTATGPFLLTLLGRMLGDDVRSGLVAFGIAAVPIALGAAFATRPAAPDA